MPEVKFHAGCSPSSPCCKASSLHFSAMASSFIFSHQSGSSLIRLERAHIRSSTIWGRCKKPGVALAIGINTHSPWMFLSLSWSTTIRRVLKGMVEAMLWELNRWWLFDWVWPSWNRPQPPHDEGRNVDCQLTSVGRHALCSVEALLLWSWRSGVSALSDSTFSFPRRRRTEHAKGDATNSPYQNRSISGGFCPGS